MALYKDSGSDSSSRKNEAFRIVERLNKINEQLSEWELEFLSSIEERVDDPKGEISPKQIFKLRDILEKYDG